MEYAAEFVKEFGESEKAFSRPVTPKKISQGTQVVIQN